MNILAGAQKPWHSMFLCPVHDDVYDMETFSASLALCVGNPPVTGAFPTLRPVMRGFDVFFVVNLIKLLNKQWSGCWFDMPWRSFDSFLPVLVGCVPATERWKCLETRTMGWSIHGCSAGKIERQICDCIKVFVLKSCGYFFYLNMALYRLFSAILWYLQCVRNGDTTVVHKAFNMFGRGWYRSFLFEISVFFVWNWRYLPVCLKNSKCIFKIECESIL